MLLKREKCLSRIRPFNDADVIKILTGSRRAGKSKVIELIIKELKELGIKDKDIIYINFEDLKYDEIDDYKKLNDYVLKHKGNDKQYLFFDEIQHVNSFEKAINSFRTSNGNPRLFNCRDENSVLFFYKVPIRFISQIY